MIDMLLDLAPVLVLPALVALAVWGFVRRRTPRSPARFPDVPDASASASPIDAPGVTGPHSSLDPFAPPKQPVSWSQPDGDTEDDLRPSRVP